MNKLKMSKINNSYINTFNHYQYFTMSVTLVKDKRDLKGRWLS